MVELPNPFFVEAGEDKISITPIVIGNTTQYYGYKIENQLGEVAEVAAEILIKALFDLLKENL